MITSNKLNLGFLSVPNLVTWLIFNVNILGVRAWIVTDQFCWIGFHSQLDREGIKEREDGERGGEGIDRGTAIIPENLIDSVAKKLT